jgi:hypothetical protein
MKDTKGETRGSPFRAFRSFRAFRGPNVSHDPQWAIPSRLRGIVNFHGKGSKDDEDDSDGFHPDYAGLSISTFRPVIRIWMSGPRGFHPDYAGLSISTSQLMELLAKVNIVFPSRLRGIVNY